MASAEANGSRNPRSLNRFLAREWLQLVRSPDTAHPMPKLCVFLDVERAVHELTEERITIGRAPDNMIQIRDPSVSGQHAQLVLIEQSYHLHDLGSTNGTWVNDQLVTEVRLREGDRIRFGKVEARFESQVGGGGVQALPEANAIEARPATVRARPVYFAHASPFPRRQPAGHAVGSAALAAAVLAILAFIISMFGLLQIHGPK